MNLSEAKEIIESKEKELSKSVCVVVHAFEIDGRKFRLAITDKLRKRYRKTRIWKLKTVVLSTIGLILSSYILSNTELNANIIPPERESLEQITPKENNQDNYITTTKLDSLSNIAKDGVNNENYQLTIETSKKGLILCEEYNGKDKNSYIGDFEYRIAQSYLQLIEQEKIPKNATNIETLLKYSIQSTEKLTDDFFYKTKRTLAKAITLSNPEQLKKYNLTIQYGIDLTNDNLNNIFNLEKDIDKQIKKELENKLKEYEN